MIRSSADLSARAKELALLMTGWQSVTNTRDEIDFAGKLADALKHFDEVWLSPGEVDFPVRSNVFALKRGRSNRTIVLTGHFDTVTNEDYGSLYPYAFQPEQLREKIIAKLKRTGTNAAALADLQSGEFMPGRGLLDMKAGLAAGLAAMEAHAGDATILFIAVFDEEETSEGAREALPELRAMADEHGLKIVLVINLDAISDQGDGSKGRVVAYGSIGKLLLAAHVAGKQTHAGYPEDGLNAAYVMAELIRAIELAPELAEATGSERAPPPATLHARDGKEEYNVTTPGEAFVYWNVMQHRRNGADVLEIAKGLAVKAMRDVERKTGFSVDVMSYSEVSARGRRKMGGTHGIRELPAQSSAMMMGAAREANLERPAVILGFAAVPYSAVLLQDQKLRAIISNAVEPFALGDVNYFAGISDMSFFGEAASDLSIVAANTPTWGKGFVMPEPGNYPCINIGPWGRDYHTWLERLHAPYAFETLPRVLLAVIEAVTASR
jgi:arginine utilization protein RocB